MVTSIAFAIAAFYYFNQGFSVSSLLSSSSLPSFNNIGFSNLTGSAVFKFHMNWLPQVILYTSCILTSLAFSEFEHKQSAIFNLTIPATQYEKWSAKAILYIIIFPLLLILLYQVFIWLSNVWHSSDSISQVKVNILDPYFYTFYRDTFIFQCFIFAGAILYKKYSILKILLLGLGLYMIYNFVSIVSIVIINDEINLFGKGSILDLFSLDKTISNSDLRLPYSNEDLFMGIPYLVFTYIFAAVCITFSYLRFKELEA